MRADVAVAGLGPAGAALMRLLSEEGFRVVGVDASVRPGGKPCGEALPAGWLAGLDPVRPRPYEEAWPLEGLRVYRGALRLEARGPAYAVDRPRWVYRLIDEACSLGAIAVLGRRARPGRGRLAVEGVGVVEAEVVVDARGSTCYPHRGRRGVAYRELVLVRRPLHRGPFMEVHMYGVDGYAWLTPRGEVVNVGCGVALPSRVDLRAWLRGFKRRLGLEGEVVEAGYGVLPLAGRLDLGSGRLVRIGDAAGMVSPATGEGMGPAVASAGILARELARREVDEALERYRRAVYRWLGALYRAMAAAVRAAPRHPALFILAVLAPRAWGALTRALKGAGR